MHPLACVHGNVKSWRYFSECFSCKIMPESIKVIRCCLSISWWSFFWSISAHFFLKLQWNILTLWVFISHKTVLWPMKTLEVETSHWNLLPCHVTARQHPLLREKELRLCAETWDLCSVTECQPYASFRSWSWSFIFHVHVVIVYKCMHLIFCSSLL